MKTKVTISAMELEGLRNLESVIRAALVNPNLGEFIAIALQGLDAVRLEEGGDTVVPQIGGVSDLASALIERSMRNEKIKLLIIRDIHGIVDRVKGEIIEYHPWNYEWQEMSESKRVSKGIYVRCFGHGEFEVIKVPDDAQIFDEASRSKIE